MTTTLDKLIILHDLRVMKKEYESEETASKYKEMGFEISRLDMIEKAIEELEKKIEPKVYKTYKRVAAKYERPIVPTKNGVCLGCFVAMPTAEAAVLFRDAEIEICSNCGRLLYPLE